MSCLVSTLLMYLYFLLMGGNHAYTHLYACGIMVWVLLMYHMQWFWKQSQTSSLNGCCCFLKQRYACAIYEFLPFSYVYLNHFLYPPLPSSFYSFLSHLSSICVLSFTYLWFMSSIDFYTACWKGKRKRTRVTCLSPSFQVQPHSWPHQEDCWQVLVSTGGQVNFHLQCLTNSLTSASVVSLSLTSPSYHSSDFLTYYGVGNWSTQCWTYCNSYHCTHT